MKKLLISLFEKMQITPTPEILLISIIGIIIGTSVLIYMIFQYGLLRYIKKVHNKKEGFWTSCILDFNLFSRLTYVFQGFVFLAQTNFWLDQSTTLYMAFVTMSKIWILLFMLLSFYSFTNKTHKILNNNPKTTRLAILGLFDSIKVLVTVIAIIYMTAVLLGKSPIVLFSGLGAMSAVLMLVFKDSITGLAAGIQLSSNNMLSVGDWLEMPKYGADGSVLEIGLTSVKVQNWDKTITTIPTYALVSDSFKNWRGMSKSGGRRIKRKFFIDTTSIKFLDANDISRLTKASLLFDYLENKQKEIQEHNEEQKADEGDALNARRITNIGTLRAYLKLYLKNHPKIHKKMTLMVRQLDPTEHGLPVEIYTFTNTVAWAEYEDIQSDIFDHIFAIVPEFGLRIFQNPSGNDMNLIGRV